MKKKLLIFDLDGTLVNTLADLNKATNVGLTKYGYPTRTLEQTRTDIGNGVKVLIERSIPGGKSNKDYQDVFITFRDYYIHHLYDATIPYENVKNTLQILKKKGYLLAVVSNKFNEGANEVVTHFYPNLFDYIQGSVDYLNNKPSSDLVNKVLNELNVSNKDSLYIGDTEVDYQTAVNSNMDVVLVSYGYRSIDQLKERIKNPPMIISSIDGLIDLLSD